MTVAELIAALKAWPDQNARCMFTEGQYINGMDRICEVTEIRARVVGTEFDGRLAEIGAPRIDVVELA
jgi:hypothetical protein